METRFVLNPRLEADSTPIGRFSLCHARLMLDSRYPWVLLIPARSGVREIHELDRDDRYALIDESSAVASKMAVLFGAEKMNIAALGNVVSQLHVHHIARFERDPAWPNPVWGRFPSLPYDAESLRIRIARLRDAFLETGSFDAG
jgi:diadenosine tetraphosphate (Ap4A) HIT family hydrolase